MIEIQHFFDERTSTLTYLVCEPSERVGVVIDPVLDFDPASGATWTESADRISETIERLGLAVPFVLDTHAHADHLTAMPLFQQRFGAKSVIGAGIAGVQRTFREIFNLSDLAVDGSQFDVLMREGEPLDAGAFAIDALHTPGHTPACMSYRIGDALFVGDTLFMPDYGTARCDFPGGSAETLYDSLERLYALPPETRIFTCHDYQPGGRALRFESTLAEQRAHNVQRSAATSRAEFVAFRQARDATLSMPKLILPAIQVNVRAGAFPPPEANGVSYLKIPLDRFGAPPRS